MFSLPMQFTRAAEVIYIFSLHSIYTAEWMNEKKMLFVEYKVVR